MKIKCHYKDCGYEWKYKGNSKFYVTCPRCLRKINIQNQSHKKEAEVKGGSVAIRK